MTDNKITRRDLLIRAVQLPAVGAAVMVLNGCGKQASLLCADPDVLSESEMGLRRSLSYVEVSEDPNKTCASCAFFTPASDAGCGECEMFKGGPVNPTGHCISWSAKS